MHGLTIAGLGTNQSFGLETIYCETRRVFRTDSLRFLPNGCNAGRYAPIPVVYSDGVAACLSLPGRATLSQIAGTNERSGYRRHLRDSEDQTAYDLMIFRAFLSEAAYLWCIHKSLSAAGIHERKHWIMPASHQPLSSEIPECRPVTVWFDSACPICKREISIMRGLDWRQRINFVDIYAADTACPVDVASLLARFHARDNAGHIVSGAAAFALMWQQIPILAPLGYLAKAPVILRLLERAYGNFLRWRKRRQCRAAA